MKLQAVKPPEVDQNFREIERQFPIQGANLGAPAESVTSLPTSGLFVGKQVIYKVEAALYWLLVYLNEDTTFPWNFLGGPSLIHRVAGGGTRKSTAYGDCTAGTTTVPKVKAPLKGLYIVDHGVGFAQATGGASTNAYISIEVGATAAVDADACRETALEQFEGGGPSVHGIEKTLAASEEVKQKYKANTTEQTWEYTNRWVRALPRKVG